MMRWYLPSGTQPVCLPSHLPPLPYCGLVAVTAGPDGRDGCVAGGVYQPGEPGWIQVGAYWINASNSTPSHLLRLDARDGIEIEGAEPGHRWLVPTLLRPVAGGMVWAGVERAQPGGSWAVPPPPEPFLSVGQRLSTVAVHGTWDQLSDTGVADLALDLLCLNYHCTPAEVRALGWLSRPMATAIFAAACSLPIAATDG